MPSFDEVIKPLRAALFDKHYSLATTRTTDSSGAFAPVSVTFPSPIFDAPIIAVPDVHLGDGGPADIFANGALSANRKRLYDVLHIVGFDIVENALGGQCELVQLGDWYDLWRGAGGDVTTTQYKKIEDAYTSVVRLDADLGLKHLIGNHDASFLDAIPMLRASQANLFPLGSWLAGYNVFGIHSHQLDRLQAPANAAVSVKIVAIASGLARLAGDAGAHWRHIQEEIDKMGDWPGIAAELGQDLEAAKDAVFSWLRNLIGTVRPDPWETADPNSPPPPIVARRMDPKPLATDAVWRPQARFVARDNVDAIVRLAIQAPTDEPDTKVQMVIVGHSHLPSVSWATAPGSSTPIVVIDAGSWTYGSANLLVAAGDTATLFDVLQTA